MAEEPILERRFLGMVEVDSGTLHIGDPLYCLRSTRDDRPGIDFQAVLDAPEEGSVKLGGQPVMLLGRFGGDGPFPVFADVDEDGTLVSVTVHFVEPVES